MIFDTEMIGLSLYDATTILLQTLYKSDPSTIASTIITSTVASSRSSPQQLKQSQEQHEETNSNQIDINKNLVQTTSTSLLSFNPTSYITHILLDSFHLSNIKENSLSYSHFNSYEEIIKSKHQIEEEYHIQVIVRDICSDPTSELSNNDNDNNSSNNKDRKVELDPKKFLTTLLSLNNIK